MIFKDKTEPCQGYSWWHEHCCGAAPLVAAGQRSFSSQLVSLKIFLVDLSQSHFHPGFSECNSCNSKKNNSPDIQKCPLLSLETESQVVLQASACNCYTLQNNGAATVHPAELDPGRPWTGCTEGPQYRLSVTQKATHFLVVFWFLEVSWLAQEG